MMKENSRRSASSPTVTVNLVCILSMVLSLWFSSPRADDAWAEQISLLNPLKIADTSSPRDTLRSFIEMTDKMVEISQTTRPDDRTYELYIGLEEIIDFSSTPYSTDRLEQIKRILMLRAILGRIDIPDYENIPGKEAVSQEDIKSWTIPGSNIQITRATRGRHIGEFLFAADSIEDLEFTYRRVAKLPYKLGVTPAYEIYRAQGGLASIDHQSYTELLSGVDTSSPRITLLGFLEHMNRAYSIAREAERKLLIDPPELSIEQGKQEDERAMFHLRRAASTLDLSQVPEGQQYSVGIETVLMLKEVFDRTLLPPITAVPSRADVLDADAEGSPSFFQVAGLPIRIERVTAGARAGSFLFTPHTVENITRIYNRLKVLSYRDREGIRDDWEYGEDAVAESPGFYESYISTAGNLVPSATLIGRIASKLPDSLNTLYLQQTVWQWVGLIATLITALLLGYLVHAFLNLITKRFSLFSKGWAELITPIAGILVFWKAMDFVSNGIGVTGNVLKGFNMLAELFILGLIIWTIWLACMAIARSLKVLPTISKGSIDASLIQILAGFVAIVLGIAVLVTGLRRMGIDAIPLIAGLGVSGLAVALAIRPTLENLLGGIILFTDRPVAVGDYCSFGNTIGTVESIGVRSTKLRGLDRTVLTIPNAQLADMQLINWARCDKMLISTTLGIRYETPPDQLRYVLVKVREMLHAHPKIDPDTIRVRFAEYGPSSLDISVRIYALTREWNEFFAIREDVLLRINDIVRASGTGFAFPSQTLYMTKDDGLDEQLSEAAINEVNSLRANQTLPFPLLSKEKMEALEGTLDYPPRGSVAEAKEPLSEKTEERLSTEGDELLSEEQEEPLSKEKDEK